MTVQPTYTLEEAEDDVASLRGNTDVLSEAHAQNDTDVIPNTPASGSTQYSSSGQQKYIGSDGNAYNTGRYTQWLTSPVTFVSTVSASIITAPVTIGTYRIVAFCYGSQGSVAAAQAMRITGPTNSLVMIASNNTKGSATGQSMWATLTTTLNTDLVIAAHAAGSDLWIEITGIVTFTASGTLALQGRCATSNADTWTANNGTFLDLLPVS
jgi:hypothetical protein